jgi:putative flippase GtrA
MMKQLAQNLYEYIPRLLFDNSNIGGFSRLIRHLIAGGTGTLFYMVFVAVLVELAGMHPVTSVIICSLLLDVFIYVISRTWVYNSTMSHAYALPRFVFILIVALALNSGIMYLTVNIFELWYVWGLVFATFIVPATNYILSYYWAFR